MRRFFALLSVCAFANVAQSENLVGRAAGVCRFQLQSFEQKLVCVPWAPFQPTLAATIKGAWENADPSQPMVLLWNQQTHAYRTFIRSNNAWVDPETGQPAEVDLRAGHGLFLHNNQDRSLIVYLVGYVNLEPTETLRFNPNVLTLFGYPFSSAMPLSKTELGKTWRHTSGNKDEIIDFDNQGAVFSMAEAYWYRRNASDELVVREPRTYAAPFPTNSLFIANIEVCDRDCMALTIQCDSIDHDFIDIFYKDAAFDTVMDFDKGWSLADSVPVTANIMTWCDHAQERPLGKTAVRFYLIGTGADYNLNGLPDAREHFVLGVATGDPLFGISAPDKTVSATTSKTKRLPCLKDAVGQDLDRNHYPEDLLSLVTRVYIECGNTDYIKGNRHVYPYPKWFKAAYKQGGRWRALIPPVQPLADLKLTWSNPIDVSGEQLYVQDQLIRVFGDKQDQCQVFDLPLFQSQADWMFHENPLLLPAVSKLVKVRSDILTSWHAEKSGDRFVLELKPKGTGRDMLLNMEAWGAETAALCIDLLQGKENIVARDVAGESACSGAVSIELPLSKYPEARKIVVRCIRGPLDIGRIMLYEDADRDDLDGDLEALAGTDPNQTDSDGDGYDDLAEILACTDPTDPTSNPAPRAIRGKSVVATKTLGAPELAITNIVRGASGLTLQISCPGYIGKNRHFLHARPAFIQLGARSPRRPHANLHAMDQKLQPYSQKLCPWKRRI